MYLEDICDINWYPISIQNTSFVAGLTSFDMYKVNAYPNKSKGLNLFVFQYQNVIVTYAADFHNQICNT